MDYMYSTAHVGSNKKGWQQVFFFEQAHVVTGICSKYSSVQGQYKISADLPVTLCLEEDREEAEQGVDDGDVPARSSRGKNVQTFSFYG